MSITYSTMQALCPLCHTIYATGTQLHISGLGTTERWAAGDLRYPWLPPCQCGNEADIRVNYEIVGTMPLPGGPITTPTFP